MTIKHAFQSGKSDGADATQVQPSNWNADHSVTQFASPQTTVTFSATPTFNAALGNSFKIILTGDVTSSTLSNALAGQLLVFVIVQDGTGNHAFAWPSNVLGGASIIDVAAAANSVVVQMFHYDGSNAYAVAPGMVNP